MRREIARLEKMEREIAIKTTQISEMVTPEPKSRNCWTPSEKSKKDRRNENSGSVRHNDNLINLSQKYNRSEIQSTKIVFLFRHPIGNVKVFRSKCHSTYAIEN